MIGISIQARTFPQAGLGHGLNHQARLPIASQAMCSEFTTVEAETEMTAGREYRT